MDQSCAVLAEPLMKTDPPGRPLSANRDAVGLTCRICSNEKDNRGYSVREMYFGTREEFTYFQCASCGCLQITTIPGDMARYYPQGYYSHMTIDETSPVARLKGMLRRIRNRSILFDNGVLGRIIRRMRPADFPLELLKRTGPLKDMSILDVGCGSGMFLYQLKEAGIDKVLGVDPFIEHDIEYRSGLRIIKSSLMELQSSGQRFDLVMFNHSFEHMPDPGTVMKAAAGLLTEKGTVLIRIPTVDSYAWEHYRENWVQLDAPRHLFLHSRASLGILATQAGLSVTEVVYDSETLQFWGSEQYLRDIPLDSDRSVKHGPGCSVFSREQLSGFAQEALKLNEEERGDQAAFFLKKRS
ncbi:MAG: class I SAM-dependent methyltransferase [Nitrospirae bacterium]|nr:MAG: class I SAM-dependent methyltransferase [Nitrospirota bacterium]